MSYAAQNTNGQSSQSSQSSNSNNPMPINQDIFNVKYIHSLRFLFQAGFSTLILVFCLFQLNSSDGKGKNDAIYWGGVTGILALWMPSPSSPGIPPANQPNFEIAKDTGKQN